MSKLEAWFGQVTTGHGASLIGGILLAVVSGQMSWSAAIPALVGGAVLLLWPENTSFSAAVTKVAGDIVAAAPDLRVAYLTGVAHGRAAAAPPAASTAAGAGAAAGAETGAVAGAVAGAAVKSALSLLVLLGAGLALSACATTPGVNSTGTPTTAAEQVAGDALTAYDLADAAWLAYERSPVATVAVVRAVEPKRKLARTALDKLAAASVTSNSAALLSAFNSALQAWSLQMVQSGVPNVPPAPAS